jgi:hypothetical protein
MVFPKARLAVSAGLFLAWIGFLLYLVVQTREPVILSRPQLNVSSLVVVAEVMEKDGRPLPTVSVKKVVWSRAEADAKLAGTQITVETLADCHKDQGWEGPGMYILPLTRHEGTTVYEVTPLPLSPGYPYPPGSAPPFVTIKDLTTGIVRHNVPRQEVEEIKRNPERARSIIITEGESRIYRATGEALKQLEEGVRSEE